MTPEPPTGALRDDCDLCEAARITEWFHEDDVCWIYSLSNQASGMRPGEPAEETRQLRDLLDALLPAGTTVGIVTTDGMRPPELEDRVTRFVEPQGDPVRQLRQADARFLVVPEAAFRRLDENPVFRSFVESEHRLVTRQQHVCVVYERLAEVTDG